MCSAEKEREITVIIIKEANCPYMSFLYPNWCFPSHRTYLFSVTRYFYQRPNKKDDFRGFGTLTIKQAEQAEELSSQQILRSNAPNSIESLHRPNIIKPHLSCINRWLLIFFARLFPFGKQHELKRRREIRDLSIERGPLKKMFHRKQK